MAPKLRVKRSRLAFASAITAAALPILVLDNLPATAQASDAVEVTAADDATTSDPTTSTTAATSTSTTAAPTTTTTAAPTTTTTAAPTTTTTAAPTTTTTTAPTYAYGDPRDPKTWERLARCETNGNWSANTGNGYYGGLQFGLASWNEMGGGAYAEYPHQATKDEQIAIGKRLQARDGWDPWPSCRDQLGY